MKEFADDNFKFDVNGRKLSKQVENTVGKGEIALYKQFLLFPQCFQKTCLQTRKNQGLFGKGLTLYQPILILRMNFFENIAEKTGNAANQYNLL